MSAKPFLDTNVIVYAFSAGDPRGPVAADLVASGAVVSVQILNEFANVSRRKLGWGWVDIRERLSLLLDALETIPLTIETHRLAIDIAHRHGLSIYDSLIVSAARLAGCSVLYSEDLQDGSGAAGITIRNPFLPAGLSRGTPHVR